MEQYIVLKKGVTMCHLCKLNPGTYTEFSFRKNDVTVFLTKKEAELYYNKAINKEYSTNKRDTSSYYYHSAKTLKSRREFNKKLKAKIKDKYEIKPIKINYRVLAIEKT